MSQKHFFRYTTGSFRIEQIICDGAIAYLRCLRSNLPEHPVPWNAEQKRFIQKRRERQARRDAIKHYSSICE